MADKIQSESISSDTKKCSIYKSVKPRSTGFYKNSQNGINGCSAYCRDCHKQRCKTLWNADPEYRKRRLSVSKRWAESHRKRFREYTKKYRVNHLLRLMRERLEKKYGITYEAYTSLRIAQHDACAICDRHESSSIRLVIDHCHETGIVRGLLCDNCNRALGCVGDSILLLHSAIAYLERARGRF